MSQFSGFAPTTDTEMPWQWPSVHSSSFQVSGAIRRGRRTVTPSNLGGETQPCTSQKGCTGGRGQHQGLTSEGTSAWAVSCQPTSSPNTFNRELGDLGLPSHMQQAEPSHTCCRGDFGWAATARALLGEQRWPAPARGCALLLARHIIIFFQMIKPLLNHIFSFFELMKDSFGALLSKNNNNNKKKQSKNWQTRSGLVCFCASVTRDL